MELGGYISDGSIENVSSNLITPDFIPNENGGKVLHRKVGDRDIYMVMNVDKNSELFFRNTGKVELWDGSKWVRYTLILFFARMKKVLG